MYFNEYKKKVQESLDEQKLAAQKKKAEKKGSRKKKTFKLTQHQPHQIQVSDEPEISDQNVEQKDVLEEHHVPTEEDVVQIKQPEILISDASLSELSIDERGRDSWPK